MSVVFLKNIFEFKTVLDVSRQFKTKLHTLLTRFDVNFLENAWNFIAGSLREMN